MNIKIKVINQLTGRVEIDSQMEVTSPMSTVHQNHEVIRRAYPDCQVNFVIDDNNFIFSPAYNMELDEIAYDEGRMTWDEYCNKWYNGCLSGCNQDDPDGISDEEIEKQVEMLIEEDFVNRDAVCY